MKKIAQLFFAVTLFLAATPAMASGFSSFDQKITVGPTSVLTIQETVNVDFSDQRHGIFRDIPVKYATNAGNPFNLRVKIISVTDASGNNLEYSVSSAGDNEEVKIGDPNVLVSGAQTYVITYTVSRALLYSPTSSPDQDQLYWNVITDPWGDLGMPDHITAAVILPGTVKAADIATKCFTELGSSTPGDCVQATKDSTAQFNEVGGKPLTIVVGWPKGIVAPPTASQAVENWLADNWIVFFPIIVFIVMFLLWFKKGRDPKVQGPMVVQYEPPDGVNPAEMELLFSEKIDNAGLTATIVHLAIKGYLNIIESPSVNIIIPSSSYSFELKKVAPGDGSLADYELLILNGLFGVGAGVGSTVKLADLKNEFYTTAAAAKKQMAEAAVRRGWFAKSPVIVRSVYFGIGVAYTVAAFWLMRGFMANGTTSAVSLLLPGAIVMFFGYFMPARTIKGTAAYAQALGFKEYLSKAEKYKLQWEEKENIFETFLPYAMVFGVVDKWARTFEGIDRQPPSWYRGGMMNGWSPLLFANTLTNATSSIGHALSVAPSSHGGGGFGGGGFGGGGFGGGGGGSW